MNINKIFIEKIKKFIYEDSKLIKIFTHHNVKYNIEKLLEALLIILTTGISYRDVQQFTPIHWNTIYSSLRERIRPRAGYKFNVKLTKYNVLNNVFNKTINIYLDNMKTYNAHYYTDTTFVCNKLGEDLVSNNPQIKKHKTSKISIISDDFNIPISISIDTGSKHDVSIIKEQLTDLHNKEPLLFNSTNVLIADGAYDSNPLRELSKKLKLKDVITNKNIRNCKDKEKLKTLTLSLYEKMLLRKRICVEHVINRFKKFKRINIRFDRYSKHFINFIYMGALLIIFKCTKL